MTLASYLINQRNYSTFSPIAQELHFEPDKNYLFDLAYLQGIHLEGVRAAEFLQGQLSCDVREVTEQQMRQGALCNLQGRVLALLDVVNWPQQGLELILPADLLTPTIASLAKPAMFSRVNLQLCKDYQVFGFYLQNKHDTTPLDITLPKAPLGVVQQEAYCCYRLSECLFIILVHHEHIKTACAPFIDNKQYRGSLAWHALQLARKHIEIYPNSQGLFMPHRLGLQHSSYLSFNKGCYRGQEIIARTHYRATLKHELKLFHTETNAPLHAGQKLFDSHHQQEVGEIIDYNPCHDGRIHMAACMLFEHPSTVLIDNQTTPLILQ